MIMEIAYITISPGRADEFEEVLKSALDIVRGADGFIDVHVHRGIERPEVVMLAIAWETLEAHTVGFRESDRFIQWRVAISPFLAEPPSVEHWILR
ncbi:MAG: antibiotic biosynthesis monooxygenase [Actinobacteria bacterium]|nr:antibiotic biosynthesis monooxygenase [Actinomycetota bacterium]